MSQQVNVRYARRVKKREIQPVYIVEFDGVPTRFSTLPVTDQQGPTQTLVQSPQGAGAQITVDEGRASLSNLTFSMLDLKGAITRLVFEYPMGNRKVTMKAGFVGMPEANFITAYVGRVLDFTLSRDNIRWRFQALSNRTDETPDIFNAGAETDGDITDSDTTITVDDTTKWPAATGGIMYLRLEDEVISYTAKTPGTFTGCTRGELGTVAVAHGDETEVKNLVVMEGNPIDLALQILTSTGDGTNGPYDVLPAAAGLGIPEDEINVAQFELERDRWMNSWTFRFEEENKVPGKKFLEGQIYKFINGYPITDNDGRISLKLYTPPLPTVLIEDITDKEMLRPPTFQGNVLARYFFNDIDLEFDYDFLTQKFNRRSFFEDSDSQVTFDDVRTYTAQSRGMRSNVTTLNRINRWAVRLLKRFAIPSPILGITLQYSKRLIQEGDIVRISSQFVPNLKTGKIGIVDQLMEVIQIKPSYDQATQTYVLLDTEFSYARKYGAISPSSAPPVNFPNFPAANAAQRNYAFISEKTGATSGIMGDGSDGYYITP